MTQKPWPTGYLFVGPLTKLRCPQFCQHCWMSVQWSAIIAMFTLIAVKHPSTFSKGNESSCSIYRDELSHLRKTCIETNILATHHKLCTSFWCEFWHEHGLPILPCSIGTYSGLASCTNRYTNPSQIVPETQCGSLVVAPTSSTNLCTLCECYHQ